MIQTSTLKSISEFIRTGKTPPTHETKYFNGEIQWFTPGDLDKEKYLGKSMRSLTEASFIDKKATYFPAGTLLVACIGDIGKLGITTQDCSSNQQITGIKPNTSTDVNYLYYWFRYSKMVIQHFANNAVVPIINNGTLEKIKIPLPPLADQQKIASILDAADSLRQKDQQLIEKYTALSQSLFLEMFGDPVRNLKEWEIKELADVCLTQLGKMLSKASKKNINPKIYLRNANVRWGSFDLKDMLEMDFDDKEIKKFTLLNGDLLVCEGGDIGRCAIWRNDLDDCFYQKALHRIRVKNGALIVEYLQSYFYWMSKLGALSSSASEVTFSHLTAEKLKKLKVPTPPISLQKQYAERIQSIEAQKQLALASLEKSAALFNSLLQRAFKGELTV